MARKRNLAWSTAAGGLIAAVFATPAAPAASTPPAPLAQMLERLTGPIEQVPTRWGGAEMAEPFDPAVTLSTSLYGSAPAPPPPAPPPEAIDEAAAPAARGLRGQSSAPPGSMVEALLVQARRNPVQLPEEEKCTTGPAWWRVSDADTVLWIMGTPDEIPLATKWDDTCLDRKIAQARVVILPGRPQLSVIDPAAQVSTPLRLATTPFSQRLPAPLVNRLRSRIADNPARARAEAEFARSRFLAPTHRPPRTTLDILKDAPNEFVPIMVLADRLGADLRMPGALGNPVADRAAHLVNIHNVLAGRTDLSARQFRAMTYMQAPDEAAQRACLVRVLDALDAGRTGLWRSRQVEAWATGDHESALRRMDVMTTCSYGDASVRFWSALVAQYMEKIDRAMAEPGIAVAVIELDPLFIRNGVMERVLQKGWRVMPPELLR